MRYRITLLILAILLLISVAGCAQGADGKTAGILPDSDGGKQTTTAPQAGDGQSQGTLPPAGLKEGWPAGLVPPELPEYTEGTVVNSGKDGGSVYIKIEDTDQEALGRYLEKLKSAGWIVTGGSDEAEAVIGLHTVNFAWQGGGAMLQMALRTGQAGGWPSDRIPPDVIQPQTGTLVGNVEVLETVENAWYFNYTYDGVDEAAAKQYLELLREKGWAGDEMLSKTIEWNGKKYNASIEIYETVETRTTFTCNFYIEG